MNPFERINPAELDPPRGYSHGIVVPAGARLLFVAGQTAANVSDGIPDPDLVAQFDAALSKVLAVVQVSALVDPGASVEIDAIPAIS